MELSCDLLKSVLLVCEAILNIFYDQHRENENLKFFESPMCYRSA